MRKLVFYLNLILTTMALLIISVDYFINKDKTAGILPLLALGFYQIVTAVGLTIYSAFTDLKLLIAFVIYWLMVVTFFNFLIQHSFYLSILIALYHLILCYYIQSNSKFNKL